MWYTKVVSTEFVKKGEIVKMSEELAVLKSYIETLGLDLNNLTMNDLRALKQELVDGDELGLASFVGSLKGPEKLLDYVGVDE